MIKDIDIKKQVKKLKHLPTIPSLLRELFEVLQNEQSNFADIARIIKQDQSVTERILRVANSPYFGHSGCVGSIEQAIMFLGYDLVKGICLGTTVFKLLNNGKRRTISSLWKHSYQVGILGATISEHLSVGDPSVCFVGGLLHDIGRVVLLTLDMDKYLSIFTSDDILTEEYDYFGIPHTEAGGEFLTNANIPEEIALSVKYHHSPESVTEFSDTVCIIALAEILSRDFFPMDADDGICTEELNAFLTSKLQLKEQEISIIGEEAKTHASEVGDSISLN
ncbi:MAG: HDOD domain-containing protein [Nitrospirae bacterium]|nr:MAG: HDOD domain-containing protein [Nitrospirota bacterium]